MTNLEIWKDIPNYEGLYQVSNLGNIKSLNYLRTGKEVVLRPRLNGNGYYRAVLSNQGKVKNKYVHRLVMLAFVGESELTVNHKNGVKTDNRLENLEYCTRSENMQHAFNTGLSPRGENHYKAKLTRSCVEKIKYGHKGMLQREIADIYGITQRQVSAIRLGKKWKHI